MLHRFLPATPFRALRRTEGGSILLYALVLLPVIICLTVLVVDVSRYQLLREESQGAADRIALRAAQALPDVDAAAALAQSELGRLSLFDAPSDPAPGEPAAGTVRVEPHRVEVVVQGGVDAAFDFFLEEASRGGEQFAVREQSVAELVPIDAAIVLADAASLRPPPRSAWGSSAEWPASRYFHFVRAPALINVQVPPEQAPYYWEGWWEEFDSDLYRRWATQSCFNPAFSGLKLAAISLADVLRAARTNRLALLFTPGEDVRRGLSVVRELGFFESDVPAAEAAWSGYFEPPTQVSDESCVLFAEPWSSDDPRFVLAAPPSWARRTAPCGERLQATGWGDIFYPLGLVSDCLIEQGLEVRESIYFHAARAVGHEPDGGNILRAVDEALLQLTSASQEQLDDAVERRGNLAAKAVRAIYVFSDLVPDPDTERAAAVRARIASSGTSLVLVTLLHDELPEAVRQEQEARLERWRELEPDVRLRTAGSGSELLETIAPTLPALHREVAIRS